MTPNLRSEIERREGKKFLIFRIVDFGLSHSRLLCSSRPRLLIQENSLLTMFDDQHPSRFAINQPSGAYCSPSEGAGLLVRWFGRRTTRHVLGDATVFVTQQRRRKSNQNSGAAPRGNFRLTLPQKKPPNCGPFFTAASSLLPRPSRRECFCLLLNLSFTAQFTPQRICED